MSTSRIALRYAKPLLELAVEKKVLDEVKKDMDGFSTVCSENRSFVAMLESPIIAHLKKAEILEKIFKGKVHELTLSVFAIIARKNREAILPHVARQFSKLYNEKMGFQEAKVTTTFPLDKELRSKIEKIISDVTGKKPLLTEKVDPEIVGGYVLELGDRQIDESVYGQLKELSLRFKR